VAATKSSPSSNTSEAVDDYLKAILELSGPEESRVSSNALADHLRVRAPSVTGMIQKLASQRPPLVIYEKNYGVRLTAAGKRRAWELVRHHRLLELFLHDVLKFSWDEVHDEAERLEHFISERFEDRVAAILGDPEIDPHGHAIPHKDKAGTLGAESSLLDWPLHEPGVVRSVFDRDARMLRQMERLQIKPGVVVRVRRKNAGSSVLIRIKDQNEDVRLSSEIAGLIAVGPLKAEV
jgi:DtxR family Mn-dependent transcriptional regulator